MLRNQRSIIRYDNDDTTSVTVNYGFSPCFAAPAAGDFVGNNYLSPSLYSLPPMLITPLLCRENCHYPSARVLRTSFNKRCDTGSADRVEDAKNLRPQIHISW